jgi:hypothetical protein
LRRRLAAAAGIAAGFAEHFLPVARPDLEKPLPAADLRFCLNELLTMILLSSARRRDHRGLL